MSLELSSAIQQAPYRLGLTLSIWPDTHLPGSLLDCRFEFSHPGQVIFFNVRNAKLHRGKL